MRENHSKWNIDPDRLVISGESGGGYICFAAMIVLATKKETDIVKAAFPIIPMISDYFFSDPAAMTTEERFNHEGMKVMWKLIAKVGITSGNSAVHSPPRTFKLIGLIPCCSPARHPTPC